MANNTDYTKPRTDLIELLPEPLQSDANLSIFNNIFNRYLTKKETKKVSGYIGRGNEGAIRPRQIHEDSVHRQAFQLQPIPYNKIGTVEHMASWEDMQNELERLGVDIGQFSEWGKTQKFNWVPPIDINKIINYRDYYWVDDENTIPQYITVRSTCATTTAKLTFWESIMTQYGSTFPVNDILSIDEETADYVIVEFGASPYTIKLEGDVVSDILLDDYIDVVGTTSNDGTYRTTSTPTYDGVDNVTTVSVDNVIVVESPLSTSVISLRRYDKIVLGANDVITTGDFSALFVDGFIFFYRGSTNSDLNNTFLEVASSTYDFDEKETTVTVKHRITDNTATGEASLEEQFSIFETAQKCQCGDIGGWDISQWDDNPRDPLWGDSEDEDGNPIPDGVSDHDNLITRISNTIPPTTGVGSQDELWYDTIGNVLYQYDTVNDWTVVWNKFSLILEQTTGIDLWDLALSCDTRPRIEAVNQWIDENKWVHKNDVANFASVKRANQPIIEYDWDLELNEWTYTNYNWSYRSELETPFEESVYSPARIEIEPLIWWRHEDFVSNTIIFDDRYGDMTNYFVEGLQVFFTSETTKKVFDVDYSSYKAAPTGMPNRTYVTFTERPSEIGSPSFVGTSSTEFPNSYSIIPATTSQGDAWDDYGVHWLFRGADDSLPSPHKALNPYMDIPDTDTPIPYYLPGSPAIVDYEYTTSLYAQNYLLSIDRSEFKLTTTTDPLITSRSLTRRALFGYDDIRVYAADAVGANTIREFGTYDEIGEAVFDLVDIDYINNEFILGGNDQTLLGVDFTSYFQSGQTIRIAENTGIGTTDFTVSGTSPTNVNRIKVTETISPSTTIDGNVSNVTVPVSADNFTNSKHTTVYVIGVDFFVDRPAGTTVGIVVGEAAVNELGTSIVKVRTIEDDVQYNIYGDTTVSNISYRIVDQVKTKTNQYPLFDVFDVNGNPAYKANSIFGYRTSSDAAINQNTGLRIVYDAIDDIYDFDQFLLEEDSGELLAYRDYANKANDIWYNEETQEVKFWDDITWNSKTTMSEYYREAIVSAVEPNARERAIDGLYWYNLTIDKLFRRFVDTDSWVEIANIDRLVTDANLQTIWKAGKNADLYIPAKVDWVRRSEDEYDDERSEFIDTRVIELLNSDQSITEEEATTQATEEWYASQANHISPSGVWVGDWEIPDPLYYNHLHENRKNINSRELLTHFTTIINSQETVPGWNGTKDGQYNIVNINDVNYALGGTIKEFNNGFDTLISSIMVNNVTPRSLIEYAHDQYEALLNNIKEIYRENAVSILSDISPENVLNVSPFAADAVITAHELNDNTAYLYGDSTTFTDNAGIDDIGVRNWIATLPYIKLMHKFVPERLIDSSLGLNEVVHHDSHRTSYELTNATTDVISKLLINTEDERFPGETLGIESSSLPANNITEFNSEFSSISNRAGVYWYHISAPNVLYRYVVASSGVVQPPSSFDDGTLWMDSNVGAEVLRIKNTDLDGVVTWDVVDGLVIGDGRLHNGTDAGDFTTATISAWQEIDLDIILGDIIYELETRLYDNAPDVNVLNYDFGATAELNEIRYLEYLEESFLDYVSQAEIEEPYKNVNFNATDPFTWNYKRSAQGGSTAILSSDDLTNSFVVAGDKTFVYVAGKEFYVKNSTNNDGTWETITSVYDASPDTTTIYVIGDVKDNIRGTIYSGTLPSPITLPDGANNLNDGSESGGDWHDLYEKIYGTPYPHLEPWVLQGYATKPSWWDNEYLNDDVVSWGTRTWKYKHGFDILAVDTTNDAFSIEGEFVETFVASTIFPVDSSIIHASNYTTAALDVIQVVTEGSAGVANFVVDDTSGFASATYTIGLKFVVATPFTIVNTYTIKDTNLVGTDLTIIVEEAISSGDITTGVDFINGALYTPSTNRTAVYVSNDITDNTVEGRIAIRTGMWENIRTGQIPATAVYPNGVISITGVPTSDRAAGLSVDNLPTFNYFSVNVDNVSVSSDGGTTNYAMDEILPPYWDHTIVYGLVPNEIDLIIRSMYFTFGTEIIAPNANYTFNDSGPVEWNWRSSSQYLYDQLAVSYRIDPANFIYKTFGFNFTSIGGLLIDRDVKNTASHTRTDFHGDVVNGEEFKSIGLNQWYVNFNRYDGYDSNFSDFQSLWTLWTAPLSYQFASYVDTPSLNVAHRYIDLTNFDYSVTSKRSPGTEDFWMDAFKVQILNIPYDIARYNNQLDWRFDIRTNISQSRRISYYDVHNYQFYADPNTNECTIYKWDISAVDTFDNLFFILGDHADIFVNGMQLVATGANGGTYDVVSSSYDTVTQLTTISINDNLTSASIDGTITLVYRDIPWDTGFPVFLSTDERMPLPLDSDTIIGTTKYFLIKISNNSFRLARTLEDANAGNAIEITSKGTRDHYVGELLSTFVVDNTPDTNWRQYAIDKDNTLSMATPKQIQGMQKFVDIVRGYDSYTNDSGWAINADRSLRDSDSGDIVSWQIEIERFVNYAYSTRTRRSTINDRYPVTADASENKFTFDTQNNFYITGDSVSILSSNTIIPQPFSRSITYYVIRDVLESFQLAASRVDAEQGIAIDILPTAGVGQLSILTPSEGKYSIPPFELNPFRNAVWFRPQSGIVSNIITGPVEDIRTSQLIFDQEGNTIQVDQLRVYRQDKETKIIVQDAFNSQPENTFINPEYNFLHMGGLHIFTDSYEHVMMLNNYSAGENLLYDPFIGLNVTKYEMLFNRNVEFTHRPNVGGYYLETYFNQGSNIKENFEAGVENLRTAYDTHETLESNLLTTHSRDTLGYEGVSDYLTNLNVSEKSQFMFWRGQIQSKGSINAVSAYINSRRFIDAKVDEYWAVKLGDFGSVSEKEYPEILTNTVDARSNEFKIEFIDNDDDGLNVATNFTPIKMSDVDRWYNQPEQVEVLRNNGKVMYFDMKIVDSISDLTGADVITNGANTYIAHGMNVDVIEITVNGVALEEGTDFWYINPYVIQYLASSIPVIENATIWGYVANDDAQNPSRIIDRASETQLSTIELWDPARGNHYSNAIHNVDLQNNDDPAIYASTPRLINDSRTWLASFVGTSWMDTSMMDYIPYHSDKVITDSDIRFREWGQLYDFASINLYEWVESDVLPSGWDAVAAEEEGDTTIPEAERKAGVAKFTLFEPDPSFGGSPTQWIPLKHKVDTQYAATHAVGYTDFTPDVTILDVSKTMDVYINETQYATDVAVAPLTLQTKQADIVKFVQAIPIDEEVIAVEIAAGNLHQEYEYSTVTEYDAFGNTFNKYYFWVGNKGTKPSGKNRLMSLAEAQQQLANVPSAHMFFQKPLEPITIVETGNSVARIEYFETPQASPSNELSVELFIAANTTVTVEIDGVDINPDDIDYIADGSSKLVTINVPVFTGSPYELVKISYTGLYSTEIELPNRFSQVIIRGLQGIIFDDNRYTIRFTRDFTLRDKIDVDNEMIGPSDMKNLHEEWKIFRKEQTTNIDRWMWDKITESMVGYELSNPSIRVPSFEHDLYDEKYGTDTRFGLDADQAFVDGSLALGSIVAYLTDPNVEFAPIDINTFFTIHSFDTAENIISAMDVIYNTFKYADVNRMYFSVLHDAFTTKSKYPGIFKTSMVSLHGIRPFQTSGAFDD